MLYLLAHQLSNGKKAVAYNNGVIGNVDLEEAKKMIPNWNGYHVAGTTWSASATLYWISYHPCIIQVADLEEIDSMINEERKITTERNVWGSATYLVLKDDANFNVVFDPKLIDEGISTAKPFYEKQD